MTAYVSPTIARASGLVVVVAISQLSSFARTLVGPAPLPFAYSYLGCKGNQFKNKRVLMEAIHKKKGETARVKALKEQVGAKHGASVDTSVTLSLVCLVLCFAVFSGGIIVLFVSGV